MTRESPSNIGGAAIGSKAANDSIQTRVAAAAVADQPADASQTLFGSPIAESRRQNQLQAESQHSPNTSARAAAAREQPLSEMHSSATQGSHTLSNPFDDRLHPHGDVPMTYHEEHATADDQSPAHDSQSVQSDKEDFHEVVSELMTDSEHEISFLIRHYSQHIAPWFVTPKTVISFRSDIIMVLGWTSPIVEGSLQHTFPYER